MKQKYFQIIEKDSAKDLEYIIKSYYKFNCSVCSNIDIQYLVKDNKFVALITYELL